VFQRIFVYMKTVTGRCDVTDFLTMATVKLYNFGTTWN